MNRQPTPSILDDVLTTDTARTTQLYAGNIKRDGGTQMRADLDPDTVKEYADAMAEAGGWKNFPPVITYHDGTDNWLADGFHRLAAYLSRFSASGMIPADVRSGTRRDAILHAAGANASHGLRRTNADKRRAVETLLRDDDWRHWSNREIGRRCNVSESFVREVKKDLGIDTAHETQYIHPKTGEQTAMRTANIGATRTLASETPAVRTYWAPASAPIPAGWDDDDEAEYQALLPTWKQPANQFHAISELDRITLRRVAERLSLERLDNLRFSLEERRRTLWLEERRQERSPSAISNQQLPISNYDPDVAANAEAATVQIIEYDTVDSLPPTNAPLPAWADEPAPRPSPLAPPDDRLQPAQRLRGLYQAVIASDDEYGALTGRFSDTLAVKRDLSAMIGHLEHLIAIIEHPEEVGNE